MSNRTSKETVKRPYRTLVTSRLILRPSDDKRDLTDYLSHLEAENEFYFQYGTERSDELLEQIDFHSAPVYYYTVFLKNTDVMLGYVGITPRFGKRAEGEIEFYIFREHRQNGFAKEALSALIQSFFDGSLTGKKGCLVSAETLRENESSVRLLFSLGFESVSVGLRLSLGADESSEIIELRRFEIQAKMWGKERVNVDFDIIV